MKIFVCVLLTVGLVASVLLPGVLCRPDCYDSYGQYGYGCDSYGYKTGPTVVLKEPYYGSYDSYDSYNPYY